MGNGIRISSGDERPEGILGRSAVLPGGPGTGLVSRGIGQTPAEPAPSDQPVIAGPWSFSIHEYVNGGAAAEFVANAAWSNAGIRDGMQFVAVRLTATNNGSRPFTIQNGDFGVTGDSRLVYRFVDVQPPEPVLHETVEPGESLEGWIVAAAESGEGNLCLIYESLTLSGNWADVVIALDAGAQIADTAVRVQEPNQAGSSIESPAAIGEAVATGDWVVTIHEVAEGQAVYNLFPAEDYRTTALGDTDQAGLPFWIGLRVTVSNNRTGGQIGHFPAGAFIPVDGSDDPFIEALLLTPPNPTVVGGYYPGGTRDGWMLIAMPPGFSLDLVRFRPSDLAGETRFFTLTGVAGSGPAEPKNFAVGDLVEINQDQVNLRKGPGTDTEIVTTLERGDRLAITGDSEDGDNFTWYPVQVEDSEDTGYVASHLIDLVE